MLFNILYPLNLHFMHLLFNQKIFLLFFIFLINKYTFEIFFENKSTYLTMTYITKKCNIWWLYCRKNLGTIFFILKISKSDIFFPYIWLKYRNLYTSLTKRYSSRECLYIPTRSHFYRNIFQTLFRWSPFPTNRRLF